MSSLLYKPRILFWPLGDAKLESALDDARFALDNLKQADLDITAVKKMTWWEPTEIPKLARTLRGKKFDMVLIFSATHGTVRCSTAIAQRFKLPLVIWALPTRYSLATSGIAAGYLRDKGRWVKLICAESGDEDVRATIYSVAQAARANSQSHEKRIGIIGRLSPLMISLPYDLPLLKRKLGPTAHEISAERVERELKAVSNEEVSDAVTEYKQKYTVSVSDSTLSKALRFQFAVRKIVQRDRLDAIALECWTNLFPKYGVNPCLGHLDDLTVGCEGDIVSMSGCLIMREINGVNPYLADILSVDSKTGSITLSHCAAPISLAKDPAGVKIVERTDPKSKGKTAFTHFDFKEGCVTLARFYGQKLDKLHIVAGTLNSTGDFWGGIKLTVASKGKWEDFLSHVSGNHYLVTYGDIRKELRLFAEWNKIEVVED
ncbi:MAG: hypothetical protein JRN15_23925 [Nitrososphaerota archaeon]|nr:hypothetical protein [Nitrososphaerota archaeon]